MKEESVAVAEPVIQRRFEPEQEPINVPAPIPQREECLIDYNEEMIARGAQAARTAERNGMNLNNSNDMAAFMAE